jgi:hypothetical protein
MKLSKGKYPTIQKGTLRINKAIKSLILICQIEINSLLNILSTVRILINKIKFKEILMLLIQDPIHLIIPREEVRRGSS